MGKATLTSLVIPSFQSLKSTQIILQTFVGEMVGIAVHYETLYSPISFQSEMYPKLHRYTTYICIFYIHQSMPQPPGKVLFALHLLNSARSVIRRKIMDGVIGKYRRSKRNGYKCIGFVLWIPMSFDCAPGTARLRETIVLAVLTVGERDCTNS